MKALLAVLFFFVSGFSFLSNANQSFVDRFRTAAVTGFQEAINQGFTELDEVNLQEAKLAAQTILISFDPNFQMSIGSRHCAQWHKAASAILIPTGKKIEVPTYIQINPRCSSLDNQEIKLIAMHEVFGARFGKDTNYELTSRIGASIKAPAQNKFLDLKKLNMDREDRLKSSGGSTGLGGGGDIRDIKFKIAGLKYLEKLGKKSSRIYGIPVELLHEAMLRMNVAAASDIESVLEFRAASRTRTGAIVYVDRGLYIDKDPEFLGSLALESARLFVLHAGESIGAREDRIEDGKVAYDSSALKTPYLYVPIDMDTHVVWKNSKLIIETQNVDERLRVMKQEEASLRRIRQDKEFQNLIELYPRFYRAHL